MSRQLSACPDHSLLHFKSEAELSLGKVIKTTSQSASCRNHLMGAQYSSGRCTCIADLHAAYEVGSRPDFQSADSGAIICASIQNSRAPALPSKNMLSEQR